MKKILPLLLIILSVDNLSFGQTVTFTRKSATLRDVLKAIENQTGYGYIIERSARSYAQPVDIEVKNASLDSVLSRYCKDQPLTYSITDNVITISVKLLPLRKPKPAGITITGRILNESDEPVPGATVTIANSTRMIATNDEGEFTLTDVHPNTTLLITSVNYESQEVKLEDEPVVNIYMKPRAGELTPVSVVSTGYQKFVKERNPGSYTKIDNELFNRRVSGNVLDRLDGVTAGMIFNKNITSGLNQSAISIRGRSTIFSNAEPLIVVDNFPYPGDINNINPNDVQDITILKDANAAAIWGAFAGNGVIVINTKKGRFRQKPRLTVNNNITIGGKPDAYYLPVLPSRNYIDLEELLFERGYFEGFINNTFPVALSPVVEILLQKRNGLLSETEAAEQLNNLRQIDIRNEKDNHFYRNSINQQYSVGISGGGSNNHYYLSAGFDKNMHNLVRNKSQRLTLTANNTYTWLKNNLQLSTGFAYSETKENINNPDNEFVSYPYLSLGDNTPAYYGLRQSYKNSVIAEGLEDWNLRPLEEVYLADNCKKVTDYRATLNLKYKIAKGFSISAIYQFNKGKLNRENFSSAETYFTRDLINRFTQVDSTTGELWFPIPKNRGISDQYSEIYKAQNLRLQFNYSKSWTSRRNTLHAFSALIGAEVRDISFEIESKWLYGYNKGMTTGSKIDTATKFPLYYAPSLKEQIPYPFVDRETVDRYISYFLTTTYVLNQRYIFSASIRKDESNLFGVEANKKGVPLYSMGVSWDISAEKFFRIPWLSNLKLRITHGYNGNVNKSVSAHISAILRNSPNPYGVMGAAIINPPNPRLRWEKAQITNIALDFAIANGCVEGSIEYYKKKGSDLIGSSPLDPTVGSSQFIGNVAAMEGNGIDVTITSKILNRRFKWQSTMLFNHSVDKVTDYEIKHNTIAPYYNPAQINPLEDRPLYSIYSLRWEGLDSQNGDPIGNIDGHPTKDYNALRNSSNFNDLVYSGPANPTIFGSLLNTFAWKQFKASFNIIWKAGYYFRRSSIDYGQVSSGESKGHSDYGLRWQKPGDEKYTQVPSFVYPINNARDLFYKYSEVLIEKGDHIRLQDIQISYDIDHQSKAKSPFQSIRIYASLNNVGILWKANKKGIDPDYIFDFPVPKSFSLGFKIEL